MLARLRRLLDRRPEPKAAEVAETARRDAQAIIDDGLQALGARTAKIAPALLVATGAGVAVWWWTSWARGRAESEADAAEE